MLHYETIDKSTLELLKQLQSIDLFQDLRLVGGTSLALQIGHRKSVDLDLFGDIDNHEGTKSTKKALKLNFSSKPLGFPSCPSCLRGKKKG